MVNNKSKSLISVNIDFVEKINKKFVYLFNFLKLFQVALKKKGILISNFSLKTEKSICFLYLTIFIDTKLHLKLKKKVKVSNFKQIKIYKLLSIFKKSLKLLFLNKIYININVLNHLLDNTNLNNIYIKTKKYKELIFVRRFNLYMDFIKLTSLLLNFQVSASAYLEHLSQIFKYLHKKKHNRFIYFLKDIFNLIVKKEFSLNSGVNGIKFSISGRILGKPRFSRVILLTGKMPCQTLSNNITKSQMHVHTIYGVFGFKIWIN